jgi:steroid delta-isomerase-like uncharacterized protein
MSVIDELLDPSYVNHNMPAPAPGNEGFKQVIMMFRNAYPDLHVTVEDVIAEGDKVASRGTWRGTHQGEFMGVPATGKQVAVSYSDIWRVENGKFVENWVQMDLLGLMQQLGVVPAHGQAIS